VKSGKMQRGEDPAGVAPALIFLLAGPLLWAGHLFLVYALQSVLCAFRITGTASVGPLVIEIVIVLLTLAAAGAQLLSIWQPQGTARVLRAAGFLQGENGAFMVSVMRLLSALSLAGVLWAGATVLFLETCPQLR
jgi:hypothetical protein